MLTDAFNGYLSSLYSDIPPEVYKGLLSVFCLGAVLIVAFKGFRKGWRYVAGLLLTEYIALLYCSMVIFRPYSEEAGHNFTPFWSYDAIHNGRAELLAENLMNVAVFIPIGILLGSLLRVKSSWLIALAVGIGISVSIEAMQYSFQRGFAETDDVMHNTLGCMIGYGLREFWLMFEHKLHR